MTTDLDNEIKAGLPNNAKVTAMAPPNVGAGDLQSTALGGCLHPNDSGHKKLAAQLKTTYDNLRPYPAGRRKTAGAVRLGFSV